ncbi:MAG TPA: alpha/beta fold hydrolase, partial [Nocardioidaceae bacterium]|nr:alpha/beta fold hydrolase [Nocardioidaceae bacterium]
MREAVATLPSGVDIAYETFGDEAGRPLLLIMGLGGPALWWDVALCERLADAGFFVVRFDNRDIGRSTYFHQQRATRRQVVQVFFGRRSVAPYTMAQLADDAFGLLDHLGIGAAHVTGVSMGGMIAQTMAIRHPERVRSLVSMMSTSGKRTVGWQDPRLLPMALLGRALDRESYVASSHRVSKAIGSPGFPSNFDARERRAGETWDRGIDPDGILRQTMAVLSQPDRTDDLGKLTMPTTVIHGTADRLVHPSGGRATAAAIPGAELLMIKGLGHDLPPSLHR